MHRIIFSLVAMTAIVVFVSPVYADRDSASKTHDGKLVSFTGDKLVMTDKDGKEQTFTVSTDTKPTLDCVVAKAEDLKAGTRIRVTTNKDDKNELIAVEAIDKNETFASTCNGKVVSVTGDQLIMTCKAGKEHTRTIATDAKVTCDGAVCKTDDLKAGTRIRITTKDDDGNVAVEIEAIEKNESFVDVHDGTIVSITNDKLVMTNKAGKEHSHTLVNNAKLTCDGAVCKTEDMKAGMKIRVTTRKNDKSTATEIEAIEKDAEFSPGI